MMRRYSPSYYSPPRRGYSVRGRSPPMRGRSPPMRGYGGHSSRDHGSGSLLVRNIPLNCRAEDLRIPFERFGPVRDVYLPKDYYSGEPRGFGFVQFVDPYDASEAQYHMDKQIFGGREITVVLAAESRKRPDEMRRRTRVRGSSGYSSRQPSYYGRFRSRSRSPHYPSTRYRSRSYSPAPKRRDDYSESPRGRQYDHAGSPRDDLKEHKVDSRRPYSPDFIDAKQNHAEIGYTNDNHESRSRQPRQVSASPPGSRSRSADISPRHDS